MKSKLSKVAVVLGLLALVLVGFGMLLSMPKVVIAGACLVLACVVGVIIDVTVICVREVKK